MPRRRELTVHVSLVRWLYMYHVLPCIQPPEGGGGGGHTEARAVKSVLDSTLQYSTVM